MTREASVLRVVKEDVLRILSEEKRDISLGNFKEEIKVSLSFISKALEELEREKLIQSRRGFFVLTEEGERESRAILRKHLVFEDYFKKTRTEEEAHQIAHILEHYVSREVLGNIKKLSTFEGEDVCLTKLGLHKKGLIANIMISVNGLFERVVSMGIVPGEEILLTNEMPNAVVVKVKNKKIVLDKNIAGKIKVS
jgi:Mn-dependent DtxR family transcriptional regulator